MNILILSLETIAVSYILQRAVILKMVKDAALAGYRFGFNFDLKGFVSLRNYPDLITILIPFYNLYEAFLMIIQYNDIFSKVMSGLIELKILEKMNESEIEDFGKNPTLKNAMSLPKKMAKRIANCQLLTINDNNKTSYVYFEYTNNDKDIEIVKVIGYYEFLSPAKQKAIVLEILNGLQDEEYLKDYNVEIEEQTYEKTISNETIKQTPVSESTYSHKQSEPKKLIRKKENNQEKRK